MPNSIYLDQMSRAYVGGDNIWDPRSPTPWVTVLLISKISRHFLTSVTIPYLVALGQTGPAYAGNSPQNWIPPFKVTQGRRK